MAIIVTNIIINIIIVFPFFYSTRMTLWHTDDTDDTDFHRLNINIKKINIKKINLIYNY